MIQRLGIKNFLSHKNSVFEFVPGLNIIVGESKAGKTSAMEAMYWLANNRPLKDSFRSDWGGQTNVSLKIDQNRIVRVKDDDINEYVFNKEHFQIEKDKAVPVPVQKALNLTELNFQMQFESHFLLSETPGKVAEHYNEITHLNIYDEGRKKIQKWLDEIEQNVKSEKENRKRLEKNLQQYENLSSVEEQVENLESMEEQRKEITTNIADLENLIQSVQTVKFKIVREKTVASFEDKVTKMLKLIEEKRQLTSNIESMEELSDRVIFQQSKINKTSVLVKMESQVKQVSNLYQKRDNLQTDTDQLDVLIDSIQARKKSINKEQQLVSKHDQVNKILSWVEQRDDLYSNIDSLKKYISHIQKTTKQQEQEREELDELRDTFNEYAGNDCPLCLGTGKVNEM